MRDLVSLAVMPVLVGPLQVLLALLPAILAAVGGALLALFKPSGLKRIVRFLWHQKLFTAVLTTIIAGLWLGYPQRLWSGSSNGTLPVTSGDWTAFRGGPHRTGGLGGPDPASPESQWTWRDHATVYSSPTVAGDRVYFTSVTGLGPFTPQGRGAVVCVEAETGREIWRYEPPDFRATFSSPVIAEGRLVVGEGLHQTSDARVTCLDLAGRKLWERRTGSHVESTACIHSGRVFIGAGGDGFYCFALEPMNDKPPESAAQVLWRLPAEQYPDCESSPISDGRTVWFGLGEGGNALCAVDAETGKERWRRSTKYPVFAPPTLVDGKLIVGMGHGNFMRSAEEIRAATLEAMKDEGRTAEEIAAASDALAPAGEVWCVDAETGETIWTLRLPETVLDGIPYHEGKFYGGCRDGRLLRVSVSGEIEATFDARGPILASPAVGDSQVFVATRSGMLHALDRQSFQSRWELPLQNQGNLVSSPAVAFGKVFIGTESQGLRCVGGMAPPEPPLWNRRHANDSGGGLADSVPLPEAVTTDWELPLSEPAANGTANRQTLRSAAILEKAIYLVTSPSAKDSPLSYDASPGSVAAFDLAPGLDDRGRRRWRSTLSGRPMSPILGTGDRLLLLTEEIQGDGDRRCKLAAFDSRTGKSNWKLDAGAWDDSASLELNRSLAVVTGSEGRIQAFDVQTGRKQWAETLALASGATRVSAPSAWNDYLAVLIRSDVKTHKSGEPHERDQTDQKATGELCLLDAFTGQALWRRPIAVADSATLTGVSEYVILRDSGGIEVRRLIDGEPVLRSTARGLAPAALEAAWRSLADDSQDPRLLEAAWGHLAEIPTAASKPLLVDSQAAYLASPGGVRRIDLATGSESRWWDDERPAARISLVAAHGLSCAVVEAPSGASRLVLLKSSDP